MLTVTALLLGILVTPQAREARPPQTDETISVARGTRLTIENFAGEVIVKAWDRDQLRVQARHGSRTKINVRQAAGHVAIRSTSSGAPGSVDYEISVPAWMPMKIDGTFNFVTVEGTQGEVSVETVRGDVLVKGGSGTVTAKSIQGEVVVEGTRGRVIASSVQEGIRLSGVSGEIVAETNNGTIELRNVTSSLVELATINGHVIYEGPVADKGRYKFTTHNGNIILMVPETSNVTFVVRTYQGSFRSAYNISGPPREEQRSGRRLTYTMGNGSAEMELESFGGSIRLQRPGTQPAKGKSKDKDGN